MAALDSIVELSRLLDKWSNERPTGESLLELLERIAVALEVASKEYYKQDPDPFDERHPCRTSPDCALGHMLKKIVRCEDLVAALCGEYLDENSGPEINLAACHILLNLTPGLDQDFVVSKEGFLNPFIIWAERATNPLRMYATAILGSLLSNEEVAQTSKEKTACLAQLMLERLHELSIDHFKRFQKEDNLLERPFACLNKESKSTLVYPSTSTAVSSSPSQSVSNYFNHLIQGWTLP